MCYVSKELIALMFSEWLPIRNVRITKQEHQPEHLRRHRVRRSYKQILRTD